MITKAIKLLTDRLSTSEIQERILQGSVWMFVGVFITKIFDLLSIIIIARILTPDEFGRLSIIKSSTFTFILFSVGCFGVTATKYIAKFITDDKEKCENILSYLRVIIPVLSLLLSLFVFFLSESIAQKVLNDISLNIAVKLTSIAIFFSSLNSFQKGILAGLEKFKTISLISVFSGFFTTILIVTSAYNYGLEGVFFALPINSFILWLFSIHHTLKALSDSDLHFQFGNFKYFKSVLKKFTLPSFLSGMLVSPTTLYCNILLINIADGYTQMAIYTAAYNFSLISTTINNVVGNVLYPVVIKSFNSGKIFVDKFNIYSPFFLSIIINTPLIFFPEIMGLTFGDNYSNRASYITLIVVLNFTIIFSLTQGISRNFAAANKMWLGLLSNIVWCLITIFSMILLKKFGAIGRSSAFLIGYFITNMFFIPLYIKKSLIPKGTLSLNILIIFVIVFFSNLFFILDVKNILLRLIFMLITFIAYYKYFKKSFKTQEILNK